LFKTQLDGSGEREISTTMAFVRMLTALTRDKQIGKHIVPIVPDEARTFGMEGMFRQVGIYASKGQLYEPEDAGELMYYREDKSGQILEEGINEAGAASSWIAAATAYSNHNVQMVPFYIYYSMFGFQRIGDFVWAAGDMQARGFLIGATAGRTTLAGEGLQHQDGHSLMAASAIPNCRSYDPTFAYELAVIIQDGLRRMIGEQENIFYYVTCMNENYAHPPMPPGVEDGILKGMYLYDVDQQGKIRVQLMGSGTILREVIAAAELLRKDHRIRVDVWSVTSFNELRREALEVERWNQLHPEEEPRKCYIEQALADRPGPFPGYRWLRAQRRKKSASGALRGRPAFHCRDGAEGACGRRCHRPEDSHPGDQEIRHRSGPSGSGDAVGGGRLLWQTASILSYPTSAISPTSRSSKCLSTRVIVSRAKTG
jgi:pyruvate dehydrogenase E1 component